MADHTHIEWTDATWNPVTGCSIVSPGCTNCYAMKLAGTRLKHHPSRAGLTVDTNAGPVWNGQMRLNEKWLTQPLKWKRARMIFVCAHGDLFAEAVPDEWIDRVFAVMALAPHHTFQVLTKRAKRMREYVRNLPNRDDLVGATAVMLADWTGPAGARERVMRAVRMPLPNVWLGVSAEDQTRADERIPELLATPAAIRFVSAEPLLGPIDFTRLDLLQYSRVPNPEDPNWPRNTFDALRGRSDIHPVHGAEPGWGKLDWVIGGGESGPGARPMHPAWARQIRDQCAAAGVAFFMKQWGEWLGGGPSRFHVENCRDLKDWGDGHYSALVGKKAAGRLLDGVEHNGFPEPREVPFR